MRTILFIDDSESYRFLIQEELLEEGYKVVTANNNDEVLKRDRELRPDLIIIELRQRNIKEETFERLKNHYPDIPWIGYSTFTKCPEDFRKWVNFYLEKSVDTDGIKELVRGL